MQEDHTASFFNHANPQGNEAREQLAQDSLEMLIKWLKEGGNVGIHGAHENPIFIPSASFVCHEAEREREREKKIEDEKILMCLRFMNELDLIFVCLFASFFSSEPVALLFLTLARASSRKAYGVDSMSKLTYERMIL